MADWPELFGFSVYPVDTVVRGSAYTCLFLFFRLALGQEIAAAGVAGVMLLALISNNFLPCRVIAIARRDRHASLSNR